MTEKDSTATYAVISDHDAYRARVDARDVMRVRELAEFLALGLNTTCCYMRDGTVPATRSGDGGSSRDDALMPGCGLPLNCPLMGWIVSTPECRYRVNWRDESGRQRARTVRTKKEATAYLAQVETDTVRGVYVDPHAVRRVLPSAFAEHWLSGRTVEVQTAEIVGHAAHSRPPPVGRGAAVPDRSPGVQQWLTELGTRRAPATPRLTYCMGRSTAWCKSLDFRKQIVNNRELRCATG